MSENQSLPIKDEQTDKRMHEHLSNENDEITEDDIRNIITDMPVTQAEEVAKEEELEANEDDVVKDDTDPQIENDSWNVLGS